MEQYSQHQLKAAPTKDEHLVRKIDLDRKVALGIEIERLPNGQSSVQLLDTTVISPAWLPPSGQNNVLIVDQNGTHFAIPIIDETRITVLEDELLGARAALDNLMDAV